MANFVDERGYLTQVLDYLSSGVSPSEYQGAHQDIDKLIANADKESVLSKLFDMSVGRENVGVYRHLDPSDSTVNIIMGLADQYYRNENIPIEELLYKDAMSNLDEPMSQVDAARLLAQKRNQ
tara:strand:+ start:1698 stop:2066 length:369 start_codon:yes stop_codon:yes gene_type:complete